MTMESLYACALDVLTTCTVLEKASKTILYAAAWEKGEIINIGPEKTILSTLSFPENPMGHAPTTPSTWNGKGSKKMATFLHGVLHAEGYAIDLMWDLIGRFQNDTLELPRTFYDDWVRIAGEEARHFTRWSIRFEELTGMQYGSLPVQHGLWKSAVDTQDNLIARLVVVHGVHEARGLDVYDKAKVRLEKDEMSSRILEENYREEIGHVAAAMKWFFYICEKKFKDETPVNVFHTTVRKFFAGDLLPPFNTEAREKANMPSEFYLPLAKGALTKTQKP